MLSRVIARTAPAIAKGFKPTMAVRSFGGHAADHHHKHDDGHHHHKKEFYGGVTVTDPKNPQPAADGYFYFENPSEIPDGYAMIPEFVDTLEWTLDSPPNLHEFTEPPVVVIIEHLENLKFEEV